MRVLGILIVLVLNLGLVPGYVPLEVAPEPEPEPFWVETTADDDCSRACADLESHHPQGEAPAADDDDAGAEVGCGVRCRVDHCSDGCKIWEQALNSSCQDVCNVTQRHVSVKELYCTVGCQNAINQYFQKLKADIGVPPTPILVEDSLAATSLSLRWENKYLKRFDYKILYFAQWKFEDVPDNWQYCDYQSWNGDNRIFLHNLQPYTRYRFRLAILLASAQENDTPIFSLPSSRIMTYYRGPPTSAPVILKALAIDHSRIYVNWKPGLFTNGPLFSYVLRLKQEGREAFQIKDIPVSQDTFMFQALDPNTNYSVTLTMRNGDGEGPVTSTFVKTLFEPDGNSSETPTLIIASQFSILKQTNTIPAPKSLVQLYTSNSEIRDTAVLAAPVSQLFLCDSRDRILRVSLNAPNKTSLILEPNSTSLRPWALSADWLHGWLYVAGANDATGFWEISRCDFDGRKLKGLLPGLMNQPIKLEVDPVNGYLFWSTGDGIYRVDLADFEEDEVQVEPEQILKKSGLGAFMVDYENTRLFVTYQSENTIKSVSLDGKVVIDVRVNTKQPRFKNVSSITMTNGLFYWTDGDEVFAENYESNDLRYFYSVLYSRVDNYFMNVHILATETQPTPFPSVAPTNVQALVLSDRVRISWRAPESKSLQGRGAWLNWSYALLLEDDINKELIQEREIRETEHSVLDLRDNSLYTLKIAAYSAAGDGPWSAEFKIQTFRKELNASILWSTNETLIQTDLIGGNPEILFDNAEFDLKNPLFVSDLDWYKDTLFLVGNNSKTYHYNVTTRKSTTLKAATSIAVEWLTEKIYWADPKRQIIVRSNFDGAHEEPIVFSKIVKNLILDTVEAYLYWATSRTVEVVRLNGEDRRYYRPEEDFNGRHVAGLTLDQDNRFLYWVVGDHVGEFKLYRSLTADMLAGPDINPEMVSAIPSITGFSLSYISNRFFYLSSPQAAIISDAYGKYVSSLTSSSNSSILTQFVKIPNPPSIKKLIVQPEPVQVGSIAIEGTWRDFNVTWKPSNNTNYGRVFYEVTFVDPINVDTQPVTTTRISVSYPNADRLLPYTLVFVYVRAYTYWESAQTVSKVLRSPQSVPSQPLEPRIFIESYKDAMAENVDYFATFRWSTPEFENGPILGFKVRCWFIVDGVEVLLCDSVDVPAHRLEYKIHNLQPNTTHYFQVSAKTEIGTGLYTEPVSTSTDIENPVPQLLVATMEDVKKVDLDQRTNVTITPHIAVEVAHIAAESKIYWINEMQELVTAGVEGNNITKILTLNNTALSLCVDWISRNLFWTESSYEESGISHIMQLDLTVWEAGILKFTRILSRNRRIVNLDIAPLTGTLFWIELSDSDLGYVIQSDLSGDNVQPFFNHTEDCSCPFRPKVQPVFTVDNTEAQSPVIYWISDEGHLNIADIEGCSCSHVLESGTNGLPPTSLTTDKSYVYWSDMTIHKIHYTNKSLTSDDILVNEYPINDVRNILAIGKSLQPYPDSDCLMPQRAAYNVQQISKTSTSITVQLPEPTAFLECEKYNLPATLYTVDLTECKTMSNNHLYEIDDQACDNKEERIRYQTYWKEFEAKDLKPFTKYRFKVTLTNYYSDQELINIEQYGSGLVLRTGAGVPSKPEDVRARPLTPTSAIVDWLPPVFLNAEYVRYNVFWRSTVPVDDVFPEGEKFVRDGDVSTRLENLVPGQEYFVFVRVYPENSTDVYSQSEETSLVMYPEPNNLTLLGVTSDAMNISWVPTNELIVNYTLEYARNSLDRWEVALENTRIKNRLIYFIKGLNSKESYKFRLVLRYRNYTEYFVWPSDGRFTFQTLEDIPTAPGTPVLVNLQNSNYRLRWEPAKSHGFQIISYYLEGTIVDYSSNATDNWISLYNGSENVWSLEESMHEKYFFRVRARNDFGYGNWSEISSVVDLTEMTRAIVMAQEHLGLILGLCVPLVTIALLCFCYFLCPFNKKPKENHKKIPIKIKPKVELATLREIPRGNFVESNALYVAAAEANKDDSLLPKVPRDQISLAKFLGSGAFGEVFQGVVRDLESPGSKTPIAVKTLRKGATAQEKNEFVQEAKLMSHFQHKHVLRLLGVCLDTDPPLLLLELMAGGDLLSYLRTGRSLKPSDPSALRLQDLLSMCEDVARGCRYLEELHFVHRDLACRNCLVSARERENRVVKIGDFGLARDIYKNDYYRKEGEGLLPVRWMAPESLVDGVFTSQSDVWAFGVLMWEITSLGQQPYQARTNLEVLHHVRAGGRLPKPLNCPPRLHQLMLRCWSAVDARPSFKVCLEHIVALRNCTEDSTLSPVNPGQFLVHGNAYKSSHFKDNLSIQSLLQDSEGSKPAVGPKYSWHLEDVLESKDPRAAYEIPKSIPVVVESTDPKENRYIEICSSKQDIEESTDKPEDDAPEDETDSKRVSVTSLNLLDKRSSSASLGDKIKTADGLKQSGSYARLVGNGESVSSLSDWRRVKKIATEEREKQGDDAKSTISSNLISYSMVSFPQNSHNETTKTALPKINRSKSSLQTGKPNIPLVINSGLLNMLRQETEIEDEDGDNVNYANIDPENVTVTDL